MLPHLASRLFGTPLLVHRAKLDVILAVLGDRLDITAPRADLALPSPRSAPVSAPGIAVIPVVGTLVKRTVGLEAASGLTSYAEVGAMLAAALADPSVAGILLDVDSPGGEASGSFELARQVRAACAVKPVWAVANDSAFSAAYAIASSAQRLIVTETGGVGSIGVIALHVDQSVKDANDGYRFTAITAGSHKNDFSPHEPLAADARAELQAEVDRLYGLFAAQVSAHRGMTADAVRATEAGLFFGPNAVSAGLADGVGTFESALAEFTHFLTSQGRPRSPARASSLVGCAAFSPKETVMQNPEPPATPTTPATPAPSEVPETHAAAPIDTAALLAAARSSAVQDAQQSTQAIAEMTLIAGCPERAAEFIAAGKSEAEVRRVLIEARAIRSEAVPIHSAITPEAGSQALARPETSPIVNAVKKLIAKE